MAKPIIDVHAHLFNARDIPLKGYLLSRKYEGIQRYLSPLLIPLVARCIRRNLLHSHRKSRFGDILCKLVLAVVYTLMGQQYRQWVDTLSKDVGEISAELIGTYGKDNIDLYIPLMIDYEYWFKNSPDTQLEERIDTIAEIVLTYEGLIHPFVPFDPARELAYRKGMHNPDGQPEHTGSLDLVKEAIEKRGFIGIKLYNAMGYRPFDNAVVEKERQRIALHKKEYVFEGSEYDAVLLELYDYCVAEQVPITTHCGMYGIESYHDASFDFGQAAFWREILNQSAYRQLHLNLAHFGWSRKEGHRGKNSWVIDICEMLKDYEHLYTDVAHHDVVVNKHKARYTAAYGELVRDYPILKKRLLFGIDWHVFKRVKNFEQFKDSYISVLKQTGLFSSDDIGDFLGANALRFLGLQPGGRNRERLKRFYRHNDINPPPWFRHNGNQPN